VWYNSQPAVAAQMLWFSYGDSTYRNNGGTPCAPATSLQRSIDIGAAYEVDVLNLPAVITYAHSVL